MKCLTCGILMTLLHHYNCGLQKNSLRNLLSIFKLPFWYVQMGTQISAHVITIDMEYIPKHLLSERWRLNFRWFTEGIQTNNFTYGCTHVCTKIVVTTAENFFPILMLWCSVYILDVYGYHKHKKSYATIIVSLAVQRRVRPPSPFKLQFFSLCSFFEFFAL